MRYVTISIIPLELDGNCEYSTNASRTLSPSVSGLPVVRYSLTVKERIQRRRASEPGNCSQLRLGKYEYVMLMKSV